VASLLGGVQSADFVQNASSLIYALLKQGFETASPEPTSMTLGQ